MRLLCVPLLVLLLAGCSSQPVYAPVGSRDSNQKHTTAKPADRTSSETATVQTYPVRKQQPVPRAQQPVSRAQQPVSRAQQPVSRAQQPVSRAQQPVPRAHQPVPRTTPGYHIVRRGETLYSIAWQHGLGFRELAAMNHIHSPYTIYTGQRLRARPVSSSLAPQPVAKSVPKPAATAKPAPVPTSANKAVPSIQPVATANKQLPGNVRRWVWPTKGQLLKGFHPGSEGQKGIDIGGKTGQSVIAAADGKVVYAGSGLVGYGRLIIIKHTESLLSAYGHNSELLVAEGQHVKAGQNIARMGNSGTDRTQLYFEIRKDGKPVNPLRYLPKS
ncbi:MAG: peptidoglycan DD-metalloendopeptidase family protein [Pseudomonadota bacterium]